MLKYKSNGRDRRALAGRLGELTGLVPYYTKAPLYAYVVGHYAVDCRGDLLVAKQDGEQERILRLLSEEGYIRGDMEQGTQCSREAGDVWMEDGGMTRMLPVMEPQKKAAERQRTAAYIRVSTDSSDQENSYETQERYFRKLLAGNPDWSSAGIYFDYASSGTQGERRKGFQRLLRHCADGKIDRIVCKSITRFARNTCDFMTALGVLRASRVSLLFEKEGLDTEDDASDFILTALGAVAQEESRSISENIRWSMQKRFPKGEVRNYLLYGYRYSGEILQTGGGYRYRAVEIMEEEAEIVRSIYRDTAAGRSFAETARKLNRLGIPAPVSAYVRKRREHSARGQLNSDREEGWTARHIGRIVRQERYAGDVLIQKTYTPDYLTHRVRRNRGEAVRYLAMNHHPAIVSRELYDEVQLVVQMNRGFPEGSEHNRRRRPFSGRLFCAECGRHFHVRNTRKNPIWYCPSTALNNGRQICTAEKVYEEQVVRMFRRAAAERFHLPGAQKTGALSVLRKQLEELQRLDFVERDRCLLKRRILAAQADVRSDRRRLDGLKAEKEAMERKKYVLGEKEIAEEQLSQTERAIAALQERLREDEAGERQLARRLEEQEAYWELLEQDYALREQTISWMKTLDDGRAGAAAFLDGITDAHAGAFALSITVYSPVHYCVHWFDNTRTDVRTEEQQTVQKRK